VGFEVKKLCENVLGSYRVSKDPSLFFFFLESFVIIIFDVGLLSFLHVTMIRMITSVAFHPSGTVIASASTDKSIKLFDIRTHKLIQHYGDAHSGAPITSLQPQNITSADGDGPGVRGGGPNSINFGGPGGEWLISTGMDGVVKVRH
jgi:WD40 repeat protein